MTQLQKSGFDAQHTVDSSEWFTPPTYVALGRAALGGRIDLDPASCVVAQTIVRAGRFFTIEDDGLEQDWNFARTIWLNPPNPPRPWAEKLKRWHEETGGRAIFEAYSLGVLGMSSNWILPNGLVGWPTVLLRRRIDHWTSPVERLRSFARQAERRTLTAREVETVDWLRTLEPTALVKGASPSHDSAFVGVGLSVAEMREHFGSLGPVVIAGGEA